MRGATRVSLQLQQLLRLPQKMTLVINPLHTWNAIYTARSNKCHCPNWPNIAPATKQESQDWSLSHMKRYLQCGADPRMIRGSDPDPKMKPSLRNPPRKRGYFSRPPQAFCIEKYNISRSGYHSKFHRILRPRNVTVMTDPRHIWNVIYNVRESCACHAKWLSKISEIF